MEGKLKIWILVGKGHDLRVLDIFDGICEKFEVCAAVFFDDLKDFTLISNIQIHSYIEDQHLPGFLFGVEQQLYDADLIISTDMSGEVGQQVIAFSNRNAKKYLFFIQDSSEFHQDHMKDLGQLDTSLKGSSGYLVSDEDIRETLSFIGIEDEKIMTISHAIYSEKYSFNKVLREKFRSYIDLKQDDVVFLIEDDLSDQNACLDLLMALQLIKVKNPKEFETMKLIFTGHGPLKDRLNYLAVDIGVSKNILFISQDTQRFRRDLLASSDSVLSFASRRISTFVSVRKFSECLTAGLIPICVDSHPLSILFDSNGTYQAGAYEDLAKAMVFHCQCVSQEGSDAIKVRYARKSLESLNSCMNSSELINFLEKCSQRAGMFLDSEIMSCRDEFKRLQGECRGVDLDVTLETLDTLISRIPRDSEDYFAILLFRAQLLLKSGALEDAMACFEVATANVMTQMKAYLGLGQIAYMSFSYEEALTFFRKALAIKPNDSDAMAGMGFVYRKSGMPEEAMHWLSQALLVDGDNKHALQALAQASLESEENEFSIQVLEKLRALLGDAAILIMALGQLYYRVGSHEKGSSLVAAALELANGKPGLQSA